MDFKESLKVIEEAYRNNPEGADKINKEILAPLMRFYDYLASKHGLVDKESEDQFFFKRFAEYQNSLSKSYLERNKIKALNDKVGFVRGFLIEVLAAFAHDEGYENTQELERAMTFYSDAIMGADDLKI